MLIFDENKNIKQLDNYNRSTDIEYFWTLDLDLEYNDMDYKLSKIFFMQETTCQSVLLRIDEVNIILPTYWKILIYDEDTAQLDVIEVSKLSSSNFNVLVYGFNEWRIKPGKVWVKHYFPSYTNVFPALDKHQMLCHPISDSTWVTISHNDVYSKYLKEKVVGDLF